MYQFLFIFFVYAFLGWCTEVSYAALVTGRFVNRGFLNGPWCPVYGFGVVIVLAFLEPLKSNLLLLFLSSVVLTSALEWATGFVLEKIFHQRWWDYSDQPFNLNGYICLRFSIAWGLACLFVVKLLHPSVLLVIRLVPRGLGWTLLALLAAVMAVDLAATVRTIAKLNRRLSQLDQLAAKIKDASNDFGEDLAERVLDAAEKGSDWKEELEELTDRLAQRQEGLREDLGDLREDLQEFGGAPGAIPPPASGLEGEYSGAAGPGQLWPVPAVQGLPWAPFHPVQGGAGAAAPTHGPVANIPL